MPRALVFLHGFTHTGASWETVVAALPPGYRAVAPDLPGHGVAADRPATLEAALRELDAVPGPFVLVGYSLGGRIALHAALSPEIGPRIQRLVLIGASPGLADPGEREARVAADERLATRIETIGIERFVQEWADTTPVLAGQPAEVRARVQRDRRRNRPQGLAAALRGLGPGALPSLWHRLDELELPVSLVVGERDLKFVEIARRMAQRLARAEVVLVPGASHAVHLEAPRRVAQLLQEVVAEPPAVSSDTSPPGHRPDRGRQEG